MNVKTKSEIIQQAFITWHLKGIKSMRTYLNTQAKKHALKYTDIIELENKINILIEAEEKTKAKKELQNVQVKEIKGSTYILA